MSRTCLVLVAILSGACAPPDEAPRPAPTAIAPDTTDVQGVTAAIAEIAPAGGGRATGTARLAAVDGGTRVTLALAGLRPGARHGVQVLHGRACDADPAVHLGAAEGPRHGSLFQQPPDRHAGDLGNVRAEASGRARYDRVDAVLRLDGTASAVGRALVVRGGVDDGATQPDGAAGAVIGCGVIEAAP